MKMKTSDIVRTYHKCYADDAYILLVYNETIARWTACDASARQLLRLAPCLRSGCYSHTTNHVCLDWHHLEQHGLMERVVLVSDGCLILSAASPAPLLK